MSWMRWWVTDWLTRPGTWRASGGTLCASVVGTTRTTTATTYAPLRKTRRLAESPATGRGRYGAATHPLLTTEVVNREAVRSPQMPGLPWPC